MMIRLPLDQAAKAVRLLANVAESTKGDNSSRTAEFYSLIGDLDPFDAARVSRVLMAALELEKDSKIRWWLAAGLCRAAQSMSPDDVTRVCGPAIVDMAEAVGTRKAANGLEYNDYLVDGFAATVSKLDPTRWSRCKRP
jgi:hypothetical protein